jgi:hypothetical protein
VRVNVVYGDRALLQDLRCSRDNALPRDHPTLEVVVKLDFTVRTSGTDRLVLNYDQLYIQRERERERERETGGSVSISITIGCRARKYEEDLAMPSKFEKSQNEKTSGVGVDHN